jgi:hypothetical protein
MAAGTDAMLLAEIAALVLICYSSTYRTSLSIPTAPTAAGRKSGDPTPTACSPLAMSRTLPTRWRYSRRTSF